MLSFPKALQMLRDQGGRAWRSDKVRQYLTLAPAPWNGETEMLLLHRPADARFKAGPEIVTPFVVTGEAMRSLDWQHAVVTADGEIV